MHLMAIVFGRRRQVSRGRYLLLAMRHRTKEVVSHVYASFGVGQGRRYLAGARID